MDYIFNLQTRKTIARQVANAVWQGKINNQKVGKARRVVEDLLNGGATDRIQIYRDAVKILKEI